MSKSIRKTVFLLSSCWVFRKDDIFSRAYRKIRNRSVEALQVETKRAAIKCLFYLPLPCKCFMENTLSNIGLSGKGTSKVEGLNWVQVQGWKKVRAEETFAQLSEDWILKRKAIPHQSFSDFHFTNLFIYYFSFASNFHWYLLHWTFRLCKLWV